jgi:hypothetical protein
MSHETPLVWVHYVPILTTILSAAFSASLFAKYRRRPSAQVWWWVVGVALYGLGTLIEATITLSGNTVWLTKAWYIAGAILGGYPLAQGSLHLSYSPRVARRATLLSVPFVVAASVLVVISPVDLSRLEPHRPSGALLAWHWVRLLTPFINTYAACFLIGGAALSAWRYWCGGHAGNRVVGNTLIAVGALLPGIGGAMAKAGVVEALYIGECIGLALIWAGERTCAWHPAPAAFAGEPGPALG